LLQQGPRRDNPELIPEAIDPDPEALAQIARLLGDDSLRVAGIEEVRLRVAEGLDLLAEGLLAEAVASDDVTDVESALSFLEARLGTFRTFLDSDPALASRLWRVLQAKIGTW
jgi:hypothetical protein